MKGHPNSGTGSPDPSRADKQDLVSTDHVFSPYEIPPRHGNERPDGRPEQESANDQPNYESVTRDRLDMDRLKIARLAPGCVDREGLGGVAPQHGSTYETTHQAESSEDQHSSGR